MMQEVVPRGQGVPGHQVSHIRLWGGASEPHLTTAVHMPSNRCRLPSNRCRLVPTAGGYPPTVEPGLTDAVSFFFSPRGCPVWGKHPVLPWSSVRPRLSLCEVLGNEDGGGGGRERGPSPL